MKNGLMDFWMNGLVVRPLFCALRVWGLRGEGKALLQMTGKAYELKAERTSTRMRTRTMAIHQSIYPFIQ